MLTFNIDEKIYTCSGEEILVPNQDFDLECSLDHSNCCESGESCECKKAE